MWKFLGGHGLRLPVPHSQEYGQATFRFSVITLYAESVNFTENTLIPRKGLLFRRNLQLYQKAVRFGPVLASRAE